MSRSSVMSNLVVLSNILLRSHPAAGSAPAFSIRWRLHKPQRTRRESATSLSACPENQSGQIVLATLSCLQAKVQGVPVGRGALRFAAGHRPARRRLGAPAVLPPPARPLPPLRRHLYRPDRAPLLAQQLGKRRRALLEHMPRREVETSRGHHALLARAGDQRRAHIPAHEPARSGKTIGEQANESSVSLVPQRREHAGATFLAPLAR